MTQVKYPHINVPLVGQDGNAFAILGRAQTAARRGGVPKDEIEAFLTQAKSGDYDHLLATVTDWFNTNEDDDEDDYDDDDYD